MFGRSRGGAQRPRFMEQFINFYTTGITDSYGITGTTGIGLSSSTVPAATATPITQE